jgi:hypothetical protein
LIVNAILPSPIDFDTAVLLSAFAIVCYCHAAIAIRSSFICNCRSAIAIRFSLLPFCHHHSMFVCYCCSAMAIFVYYCCSANTIRYLFGTAILPLRVGGDRSRKQFRK